MSARFFLATPNLERSSIYAIVQHEGLRFKKGIKTSVDSKHSVSTVLRSLARLQRGLRPFSLYIYQVFQTMPKTGNLQATARGASAATPRGAKTVSKSSAHPLLRITKKELISLIEGKATVSSKRDTRYSLVLSAFLEWVNARSADFTRPIFAI